jgi:hypothetical protein
MIQISFGSSENFTIWHTSFTSSHITKEGSKFRRKIKAQNWHWREWWVENAKANFDMDIIYLCQGPKFAMGLLKTLQHYKHYSSAISQFNWHTRCIMKCSIHQSNTIMSYFISMFCNAITRQQEKNSLASKAPTNSKASVYWSLAKKNEKKNFFSSSLLFVSDTYKNHLSLN